MRRKNEGIAETDSSALHEEIQKKHVRPSTTPVVVAFAVLVLAIEIATKLVWPILALTIFVAVLLVIVARQHNVISKSVVIYYRMDKQTKIAYKTLLTTFIELGRNAALWTTEEQGLLRKWNEQKKQGGASALVNRVRASASIASIPHIITNIKIPALHLGVRQHLYFFPDFIMVLGGYDIEFISYTSIQVRDGQQSFIEESQAAVPSDARVIGRTWKYVNKDGGPDRRFSHNERLPKVMYGTVQIIAPPTTQAHIQTSQSDSAHKVATGLKAYIQFAKLQEYNQFFST